MTIINPDFSGLSPKISKTLGESPKKMLTISTLPDGRTLVEINNSSLSLILACGRKSFYALERGLVSESSSPALVFGSAIHAALEVFYSEPKENRALPPLFNQTMDDMASGKIDAFSPDLTHYLYKATQKFIEKAEPLSMLEPTNKRSISNGIWLLSNYFQVHINDQYEVYCDEQGPMTERLVETIIHEDQNLVIKLFGTIDVVLKDSMTLQVLPGDHKTASQLGNDFYNRLKPNHQYTGYITLCREALGMDVNFFLVNALQVKEKPKTSRGTGPNFARQITTRDDQDMAEFKQTLVWAVKTYLSWRETSFWPMGQVGECSSYGGCQYLDICAAPNELRENIIKARYMEGK